MEMSGVQIITISLNSVKKSTQKMCIKHKCWNLMYFTTMYFSKTTRAMEMKVAQILLYFSIIWDESRHEMCINHNFFHIWRTCCTSPPCTSRSTPGPWRWDWFNGGPYWPYFWISWRNLGMKKASYVIIWEKVEHEELYILLGVVALDNVEAVPQDEQQHFKTFYF